jgi:hypothetical protein
MRYVFIALCCVVSHTSCTLSSRRLGLDRPQCSNQHKANCKPRAFSPAPYHGERRRRIGAAGSASKPMCRRLTGYGG